MSKRKKAKQRSSTSLMIHWFSIIERCLLALLVFLVPLAIYYGSTTYNHYKVVLFAIGLAILYSLWGIRHWFEGSVTLRFPKLLWAGLGLLIALGVSLISAFNIQVGLQNILIFSSFLLFYFYLVNHIKTPAEIYGFIYLNVIASAIAAGYSWFQHEAILPGNPLNPDGGPLSMLSSFGNLNFMTEYLGIWVFPALLLIFKHKFAPIKILIGISLIGIFYIMYATQTLGVLISLGVGALVLMVVALSLKMFKLPKNAHALFIAGLVTIALATSGWMMQQESSPPLVSDAKSVTLLQFPWDTLKSIAERYEEGTSVSVRLLDWTLALKMLLNEPLFGVGTGHYNLEFYNYKEQMAQTSLGEAFDFYVAATNHAHNDYLEFVAETGLLGFVAIVTFFALMIWGFIAQLRRITNCSKRWLMLILQVSILVVCLDAMVNFPLHLPASGFGFVLLLGILDSAYLTGKVATHQLKPMATKGVSVIRVGLAVMIIVIAMLDFQADLHFERGHQLAANELYQLATSEFEQSLALDIAPGEVFYRLGGLYFQAGDYDKAEEFYLRSLDAFSDEGTLMNLAIVKLEQGDIEAAKTYVDRLESLRPRDHTLERIADFRRVIAGLEANQ